MPSWQAQAFAAYARAVIRRRHWGDDPQALARRARRVFGAPPPLRRLALRGVRQADVADGAVRGEWLVARAAPSPDSPGVILYVHGGGYVACSAATHRGITTALARATGRRVFAVDYRVAPEHPFPAALDDVLAAYRWLRERGAPGEPIAAVGESAGGGLVLLLAQHARDAGWPPPTCVAALSPWADLAATGASARALDGDDAMFRPANFAAFAAAYLGGAPADDPRASPLYGGLHALPPVLVQVGSTELLLDDARRVHRGILAAGGTSQLSVHDGLTHAWHLLAGFVPEADAAIAEIAAFAGAHLAPSSDRAPCTGYAAAARRPTAPLPAYPTG